LCQERETDRIELAQDGHAVQRGQTVCWKDTSLSSVSCLSSRSSVRVSVVGATAHGSAEPQPWDLRKWALKESQGKKQLLAIFILAPAPGDFD